VETITKAWVFEKFGPRQRTIEEMKTHRQKYGSSGNCFDLALWLLSEFLKAKIPAYGVGDRIGTSDAHVAIVVDDGKRGRFLCDLGDLWIQQTQKLDGIMTNKIELIASEF